MEQYGTNYHSLHRFNQTQIKDVSQQKDPIQFSNNTPNGCANVFSAISNCIGVVTSIIADGMEGSGISTTYPGNDGKGVPTMDEMPSQGVGNIIKGPYIRNCTNFVPKSIGMRMDGFDAEPGDEISNGVQGSSNVDSFTQFNPGGVGCSISNGTYQQLVSIFTICCDEAIVCDSGAQLDLTNSNSSFGRLGLVARGIGDKLSKCIDRYTGIVAKTASIEDDLVVVKGIGDKRPYDGQGIFFGELFRDVVRIEVTEVVQVTMMTFHLMRLSQNLLVPMVLRRRFHQQSEMVLLFLSKSSQMVTNTERNSSNREYRSPQGSYLQPRSQLQESRWPANHGAKDPCQLPCSRQAAGNRSAGGKTRHT